ncbi:MAG: hypothetical protein FWD61_16810 [Phycisphaerales bacterium]|nr:hypothetical protein [Phycisphaerales bacterium]
MTTLQVPSADMPRRGGWDDDFSVIRRRLDALGSRFRTAQVLRGSAKFVAIVAPLTTAMVLVAGGFSLPHWLNITLLVMLACMWVAAYFQLLHGAIAHRPTYAEIARLVEEHAKGGGNADLQLHNELINAVLLADDLRADRSRTVNTETPRANTAWIPHLLREVAANTGRLNLEKTVPWKQPQKAGIIAAALLLLCGACVAAFPANFTHGLAVFSRPTTFVPMQGKVRFISVEPGNETVLAGQSVNFLAAIESPKEGGGNKIVPTHLTLTFASGKSVTYAMSVFGSENAQYRYQLATVAEDIDYIITAGDSQSERFHITVLPKVHLLGLKIESVPPVYTKGGGREKLMLALPGQEATAAKGSVEVPLGSTVTVSVAVNLPAKEVLLDIGGGMPLVMTPAADGKTFSTTLTVKESIKYLVRVNDSANRTLRTFPSSESDDAVTGSVSSDASTSQYAITAIPDNPPTVSVIEPGRDIDAKPGDKIALTANVTDDYGVTQVSLAIAKNDEKDFRVIVSWPVKMRTATVKHQLDLLAADYHLGDTLRYRFVATDNRDLTSLDAALGGKLGGGGPQSTASQVFTINFNDTAAAAAKTSKLWDELRKQLNVLLDRQVALRKQTDSLTAKTTLDEMRKIAAPIAAGQKSLRSDMAALAKDFPFEPPMKLVQKSLQVLVTEDATSAIDRGGDLLLLSETKPLPSLATKLRQHQNRIIDVLQALLAISSADERRSEKAVDKSGEDLPSEARDAWKKVAEELKKFEKDQKAVIDATAELAKKPKDQYDAKDNQKIADLAAVEDKWEKFLNNRLADMSKIAEQDQANASLLDEMVQMKIELAAAKNALEQKATEIATPLEENSLESAKGLDTHIERWLMQTPDPIAWLMDDPVSQTDQHMAELPKQLQDMIGDLMANEEDLTDEMESQGSKWSDSLNKGSGWDAADGPISNQSAQGVTGNQMPKNEEIGGRAGDGRTGQASGEFVGAEAEDKGGRKTPTRMTQDPFSSGQVNDKSKEPPGGATGGGKKGGFGSEGLEGPLPPAELQNTIKRLNGAQAALRNQAERINNQMRAAGFNNFKLLEANVQLKRAEDALRKYQYRNALYYQEQAVQSINTAKVLATGQVHVTMDTTPQVSERTQKEIESAINGEMPKGYADPVKAYFQKLATQQE